MTTTGATYTEQEKMPDRADQQMPQLSTAFTNQIQRPPHSAVMSRGSRPVTTHWVKARTRYIASWLATITGLIGRGSARLPGARHVRRRTLPECRPVEAGLAIPRSRRQSWVNTTWPPRCDE